MHNVLNLSRFYSCATKIGLKSRTTFNTKSLGLDFNRFRVSAKKFNNEKNTYSIIIKDKLIHNFQPLNNHRKILYITLNQLAYNKIPTPRKLCKFF
jgi:hypothetical protein